MITKESLVTEILFHFKNMGASEVEIEAERSKMMEDDSLVYKNLDLFDKDTQDTIMFMAGADELLPESEGQ